MKHLHGLALLIAIFITGSRASQPTALYYHDQLVDHTQATENKWTQRYYTSDEHFAGPGHPIFLVMGGEGAIPESTGLFYPFIHDHLAKHFGAYVLQPEHRFYGESQPLGTFPTSSDEMVRLVTSEQAMADAVRLLKSVRDYELGCSPDRTSSDYCPVITVGGSYPGFLSAMMRVVHPDVIDMSYAASAPMKFYDQTVRQDEYYDHITSVAESSSVGCADAVRRTLAAVSVKIQKSDNFVSVASDMGICPSTIPTYIGSGRSFRDELMMIVAYTFANYNMAYYPPGKNTRLFNACQIFQRDSKSALDNLRRFLLLMNGLNDTKDGRCFFDLSHQLPTGTNATITSGDWSGVGTGDDGRIWDLQTCTLLVEHIGFSETSMFPARPWSMDWLVSHCKSRFGVVPHPYELARKWGFDDLVMNANTSRILFTNGMNDGWSVGGIRKDLSENILAVNIETGAHHSDLSRKGPSQDDTEEMKRIFGTIRSILSRWVGDVRKEGNLCGTEGCAGAAHVTR